MLGDRERSQNDPREMLNNPPRGMSPKKSLFLRNSRILLKFKNTLSFFHFWALRSVVFGRRLLYFCCLVGMTNVDYSRSGIIHRTGPNYIDSK